jgi:NAD(P)H-flavin reductase
MQGTGSVMLPSPHVVVSTAWETADTATLVVRPVGDSPPFPFAAGQVSMLYAFGVGEVPISISSHPASSSSHWYTIRQAGAVTAALTRLEPGDVLGVRGPFGQPWPLDATTAGDDILLVAGGIGLAPLRAAVVHVLAHRHRYRRAIVVYGARTPADLIFRDDLRTWAARSDLELAVTVDAGDDAWQGHVGLVTERLPTDLDARATNVMVCGPEMMMRATVAHLAERGLPRERIWLSLERNMLCGVGLCGHCQLGPYFVCVDGPVLRADHVAPYLEVAQL